MTGPVKRDGGGEWPPRPIWLDEMKRLNASITEQVDRFIRYRRRLLFIEVPAVVCIAYLTVSALVEGLKLWFRLGG